MPVSISRRNFLKSSAAGTTGVLILGINGSGALATGEAVRNAFVRIDGDGVVTVVAKHFEMGQGTTTGLATLVAEELGASMSELKTEYAPAEPAYQNNIFKIQATVGSTAMRNSFEQYRRAGAQAADLLKRAAGAAWGVSPDSLVTREGRVSTVDGGRSEPFATFVAAASELVPKPFEDLVLKDPSAFDVIGDEATRRVDTVGKTDGSAVFGIDIRVPGMVRAALRRSPRWGGKPTSVDSSAALAVPGVVDVKAGDTAVYVFAETTWAAFQGRDALVVEWDESEAESRSTDTLMAEHIASLENDGIVARDDGDVAAAFASASDTLRMDFTFPFLAHAALEPINCTAVIDGDQITIWDACQMPGVVKPQVAEAFGVPEENVTIHTFMAGGSFGRKGPLDSHFHIEAVTASKLLGGARPVQLVYSREDDMQGQYYRPIYAQRIDVAFDANNQPIGWEHRLAGKPILAGTMFGMFVKGELDFSSVYGAHNLPYNIPNVKVDVRNTDYGLPVCPWRSVMHTHTGHSTEVAIDMVAEKVGADPVQFRLDSLADDSRQEGVLRLIAEKAQWTGRVEGDLYRGVAVHKAMNSYVAQIVDIHLNSDGAVKVEKVWCAIDCGLVINPDIVRAQMEGSIGFALGAAMRNKITLTDGVVDQPNYWDYEPLRIADMPEVEVFLMDSAEAPSGAGEPGVPPVAPALANAIFAATNKRILTMPFTDGGITFA